MNDILHFAIARSLMEAFPVERLLVPAGDALEEHPQPACYLELLPQGLLPDEI